MLLLADIDLTPRFKVNPRYQQSYLRASDFTGMPLAVCFQLILMHSCMNARALGYISTFCSQSFTLYTYTFKCPRRPASRTFDTFQIHFDRPLFTLRASANAHSHLRVALSSLECLRRWDGVYFIIVSCLQVCVRL